MNSTTTVSRQHGSETFDVLQVSHRYPPSYGGIENYARNLTKHLQRAGHDVSVLTTDMGIGDGAPSNQCVEATYYKTTASFNRNPVSVALHRRLRRSGHSDICHLQSPYMLPSLQAARALPESVPTVTTVHGFPPELSGLEKVRNLAYRPVAQYIYDRMDAVIVLGKSEKTRLLDRYDVSRSSVHVVPNAIVPEDCDVSASGVSAFLRNYGLDPDRRTVLYTGRLVGLKNPHRLVEILTQRLPDLDANIVLIGQGEASYVDGLKRTADDRFTFIEGPPHEVVMRAYHAADLFVTLSKAEGLPTVLLEAMNARLPIVTTTPGAISDVITHGEHGWLVDLPVDDAQVAEAIEYYCKRPAERAEVGSRNREYVRENFNWADVSREIAVVYEQLR